MKEREIDISANKPRLLTPSMVAEADQTITMGCSVEKFCPAPLAKNVIDWSSEDPKRETNTKGSRDKIPDRTESSDTTSRNQGDELDSNARRHPFRLLNMTQIYERNKRE